MATNKNTSPLSGISVGVGIFLSGLLLAFQFKDALGVATPWLAGIFLFIGVAGSILEVSKLFNQKLLGQDNALLGIFLFGIGYWILQSGSDWSVWIKYSLNALAVFLILMGGTALVDGTYKIVNQLGHNKFNLKEFLKTSTALIALAGSTFALLKQIGLI